MKYIFYIVSIILLFTFATQAKGQEDKKNRLLVELVKAPHDSTRLKILDKLTEATKYAPQVRLYYIDRLLKEAELQNNDYYKCQVYLYRMYMAYNMYDVASVNHWNSLLEPIALKMKDYDILFKGRRCVVDMLQVSGQYEREEAESLALLSEAKKVDSKEGMKLGYMTLGNAYYITYRYKEALLAFEKAYQFSKEQGGNPALDLEIINSLIVLAEKLNDQPAWLKYIRLEESCIENSIKEDKVNYGLNSSLFVMYIHYVAYYIKTDNLDEAGRYYELAEKNYYASNEGGIYEEFFMRIGSAYQLAIKQYDKALALSDTLLALLRPISPYAYNEALAAHAQILFAMGRDNEALYSFKLAKNGSDSSQLQILNTQTEQVKNIHNVYLLELEKEKNRHYLLLSVISFLILSILTVTGFIVYTYRSRRKLQRDEAEMRQMTHEVELANQAKERFLSNVSTSIGEPLDMVVDSSLLLASDRKFDDSERAVISEVINKTSAELMQLINNILDLSRLEAGMMRFILSDVEVFSLINDAATGASIEQGKKINIVCPQSALFWSHIDGTRLLNVFNNLFVSALPGKELQVSVEVNEDETELKIRIYGTSLAARELSQEQIIRNEINRMIVNHFEGEYANHAEARTPYVYFTVKGRFTPFELG